MRELRWYQHDAVDFILENPSTALFLDMGLGKTAVVLHALKEIRHFPGPTVEKVLLIGPIRVIETVWKHEATLWEATRGLTFSLVRGTPAERKRALETEADIYLVNPELQEEALNGRDDYTVLVVDESTLYKNPSSKRFKLLRKHLKRFTRRILMTGTPSPNSLMDLWSQIFLLDSGDRLGGAFGKFQQHYFYATDYQGYKLEPHPWAREEITQKVADLVFRMSRRDGGVTTPEAIEVVHKVALPPPARALYDKMEKEAFVRLLEEETTLSAATAAVATMKLRQIASGFVYDDDEGTQEIHQEKLKMLAEILDCTGSPVIVVYQFLHELKALQEAYPHGVKFDSEYEQPWNRGEVPLMFLHPQSGGHGINLQYGGYTMVIFTSSFSLEQMSQTMKRIDRPGQVYPPVFHFLVAENTIDELLREVLERREDDQTNVLRMIKEYATR